MKLERYKEEDKETEKIKKKKDKERRQIIRKARNREVRKGVHGKYKRNGQIRRLCLLNGKEEAGEQERVREFREVRREEKRREEKRYKGNIILFYSLKYQVGFFLIFVNDCDLIHLPFLSY